MAAKFENGTPDVFLVHELQVMYCIFVARVSLNLCQLLSWDKATHNEDFAS